MPDANEASTPELVGAAELPPTLLGNEEAAPELVGVDQTALPADRWWGRMDNGENALGQGPAPGVVVGLPPQMADLPPEVLGSMPPELLGQMQQGQALGQPNALGYIPTYALFVGLPAVTTAAATFVATRDGKATAWGALGGALGGLFAGLIVRAVKKDATF